VYIAPVAVANGELGEYVECARNINVEVLAMRRYGGSPRQSFDVNDKAATSKVGEMKSYAVSIKPEAWLNNLEAMLLCMKSLAPGRSEPSTSEVVGDDSADRAGIGRAVVEHRAASCEARSNVRSPYKVHTWRRK